MTAHQCDMYGHERIAQAITGEGAAISLSRAEACGSYLRAKHDTSVRPSHNWITSAVRVCSVVVRNACAEAISGRRVYQPQCCSERGQVGVPRGEGLLQLHATCALRPTATEGTLVRLENA